MLDCFTTNNITRNRQLIFFIRALKRGLLTISCCCRLTNSSIVSAWRFHRLVILSDKTVVLLHIAVPKLNSTVANQLNHMFPPFLGCVLKQSMYILLVKTSAQMYKKKSSFCNKNVLYIDILKLFFLHCLRDKYTHPSGVFFNFHVYLNLLC